METIDAKLVWKGMRKDDKYAMCFEFLSDKQFLGAYLYNTKFLVFDEKTPEMDEMQVFTTVKLPKSLLK